MGKPPVQGHLGMLLIDKVMRLLNESISKLNGAHSWLALSFTSSSFHYHSMYVCIYLVYNSTMPYLFFALDSCCLNISRHTSNTCQNWLVRCIYLFKVLCNQVF